MNRFTRPQPHTESTFGAFCIPVSKEDFTEGDPVSCRKAADAMKAVIHQKLVEEGIPPLAAIQLAPQISEAFYQNIMGTGPNCGKASVNVQLTDAELLKELTGDLDFHKDN